MTGNQIAYWKYAEDVRHNAEAESQGRTNLAEAKRHNLATEGLQARQISLGYAQLAETKRANQARELLQTNELAETVRYNTLRAEETERSNKAKETETNRHNKKVEGIQNKDVDNRSAIETAKFDFDIKYKTGVETFLRVGEALTDLIGVGIKIGTIG